MSVRTFSDEPLLAILDHMRARLADGDDPITLRVLDPDRGVGRYAGERVELDGVAHVHRPFRVWVELADRLALRLRTPRALPDGRIELCFERLDPGARWQEPAEASERYGAASGFARISKLEDPAFVIDMAEAIARAPLPPAPRVLDLGVNTGDELALLLAVAPSTFADAVFTGVDHSPSALAVARQRFPGERFRFVEADLGALAGLDLGVFDLVVSIGTLQSPGIDDREVLRGLVQRHLAPRGTLILGVPNCRYFDGEVQLGTRMKNFREPELGLLVKDVAFYRKYLQQHHRRVHVTGSRYLLVTGIPAYGERDALQIDDRPSPSVRVK